MRREDIILPENAEQEFKKESHLSFISFTIFDILHVLLAIFFLVYSLIVKEPGYKEDIAESIIILIFAALLISFVDALAKGNANSTSFRKYYSYAFVCASAALLVPLAMVFPHEIETLSAPEEILESLSFIVIAISMILFFVCIFMKKEAAIWRIIMLIAIVLFLLYVPLMVTATIMQEEGSVIIRIFKIIHFLTPLCPGIVGLIRMARKKEKSVLY